MIILLLLGGIAFGVVVELVHGRRSASSGSSLGSGRAEL